MHEIKIGTIIGANNLPQIPQLIELGFECFTLSFWQTTGGVDLKKLAQKMREILDPAGIPISNIAIFGNPLTGHGNNADTLGSWERLIDAAPLFGCNLVTGFSGRIVDEPVDKSIPRLKEVFGELLKRAEGNGARVAFENCPMGGDWRKGDWNCAFNPTAWEMIFDALPNDNLGLEWEPCHQLVQLIDPIPQLRKWAKKVFHVHGKDATVAWDIVRERGFQGGKSFAWDRTPGFGDSNWTDIISILRQNGYAGNIDIEGFHDPVYRGALEWTGQVRGLNYLKECRGGPFVALRESEKPFA